ncbi:calcium-binding protein [Arenibacterium sp. LLYu02]|uniref:calcium-binding protein n=1 Tax=Arenibacterium sp. LLYu02 TaxID=3404132 RepID=UPI003B210927
MNFYGTHGNDTLDGTSDGDALYGYPAGTAFPDEETGNDSLRGGAGHDRLYGGGGNDTLRGGDGYDRMYGGAGDDVLQDGGTGLDDFDGGDGNDLFLISGSGNDEFQGGSGNDTLRLEADVIWSRLILDTSASVEELDLAAGTLRGTSGNDLFDLSGVQSVALGGQFIEMGSGTNTFIGHVGADDVRTTGGFAKFTGGGGNDTLRAVGSLVDFDGGDGDDLLLLSGYGWNDTILGGSGTDTVRLSDHAERHNLILDADSGIEVFDLAGFKLVGTSSSDVFDFSGLTHFANTGALIDMGNGHDRYVGSSGDDSVLGGFGNDTLIGGAGNDLLDGGSSADTLSGGLGNDRYVVDHASDLVDEQDGDGIDQVDSSISFSLEVSANVFGAVENLKLTGTAAIDGTGNALDNRIEGNVAANRLFGGAGDSLYGGAGNDRLDGGSGSDLLVGGTGNDVYVIDAEGDRVVERASEGIDLVISFANATLSENVENLNLKGSAIEGRGNGLGNKITGNTEDNKIWGAGGKDRLNGGRGDDTLSGGAGNDKLIGSHGDDLLLGGNGRDKLIGGIGRDQLTGGGAADDFIFAEALKGGNVDHITDFKAYQGDRILLDGDIFSGFDLGRLDSGEFHKGTAASGEGPQFIYSRDSGELWFDADGEGGAAMKLVAILDNHAALNADDLFIF